MFEEEEQQQDVPPLKAALEGATAAAEAEGRTRQPGWCPPTALLAHAAQTLARLGDCWQCFATLANFIGFDVGIFDV